VALFRTGFAQWLNRITPDGLAPLCVIATHSGTATLHLALIASVEALPHPQSTQPIDWSEVEVIVPALTVIATINPVRYLGAAPVFVNVDPLTLAIHPEKIEVAITPNANFSN